MSTIYAWGFGPLTDKYIMDEFLRLGEIKAIQIFYVPVTNNSPADRIFTITYLNRRDAEAAQNDTNDMNFDGEMVHISNIPPPHFDGDELDEQRTVITTYHLDLRRQEDEHGQYWDYSNVEFGMSLNSGAVNFEIRGPRPSKGAIVLLYGNQHLQGGLAYYGSMDERPITEAAAHFHTEEILTDLLDQIFEDADIAFHNDERYDEYERILTNAGIITDNDILKDTFLLQVELP
jgi:hypothetical protein